MKVSLTIPFLMLRIVTQGCMLTISNSLVRGQIEVEELLSLTVLVDVAGVREYWMVLTGAIVASEARSYE